MRKITLKSIQRHAAQCYPAESCGLLVQEGKLEKYRPCKNTSTIKDQFRIAPEEYAAAQDAGKVLAVVHSHPDDTDVPSEADRLACEASNLPWYIISVSKDGAADTINCIEPQGYRAPLIGRKFIHGVQDCYTLVRDFYTRIMHITLPDFERADDWWNQGQNLYLDNFARAGFCEISSGNDIRLGDVILMQVRSPVPNHAAIFIGGMTDVEGYKLYPNPATFLHHMYGQLSTTAIYGGQWVEMTRKVLRHHDNIN